MMRLQHCLAIPFLSFAALAGCRSASDPGKSLSGTDTFRSGALERYTHYSDEGNPWTTAPDTLRANGRGIQSVLIRNSAAISDGWVEVDATNIDDGGLVLRFLDNENYYLLAIRDDEAPYPRGIDNLQIYRRSGPGPGGFTSLLARNVSWPRGTTRRILFAVEGDAFIISMDGVEIGRVADPRFSSGTGFGLRHYGASETWTSRYRNFSWQASR